MTVPVIAIDGPSGVGKGTVARALAKKLGWHFLDSGALYRILALSAQKAGVALTNAKAVAAVAAGLEIRFDDAGRIFLGAVDYSQEVRAETTGALASDIAAFPEVRAALISRQQAFRQPPGLVADGRDMGTVVFTDAPLKVFLDASAEERARRRLIQLAEAGLEATIAPLLAEIRARDERDRTRSTAPLKPAEDAVVIDTTAISAEGVLKKVFDLAVSRGLC
ncbi:MAG: (d)CMP kinase [Pseudomonadota bacterium]